MEKDVARLMDALRRAVSQINWERTRRRPKWEAYAEPMLGRSDLLAIERRHNPAWRDLLGEASSTIAPCSAPALDQDQDISDPAVSRDGPEEAAARVRAT